jgi:mannosyltransferase OCH1-like enzyme
MPITAKQITEAEAIEAMKNEEADFFPFRVLNEEGKLVIQHWVEEVAKNHHNHDLGAWHSEAERSANDSHVDETVTIEMGRAMTHNGIPDVLRMQNSHFDWMMNE